MQKRFIERFNRTYRHNVIDAHLLENISQVHILTEEWINDYNIKRPHEAPRGNCPRTNVIKRNSIPSKLAWKNK
ncbi:integrase core domain-containing protein [Flagellimonas lutimaris]